MSNSPLFRFISPQHYKEYRQFAPNPHFLHERTVGIHFMLFFCVYYYCQTLCFSFMFVGLCWVQRILQFICGAKPNAKILTFPVHKSHTDRNLYSANAKFCFCLINAPNKLMHLYRLYLKNDFFQLFYLVFSPTVRDVSQRLCYLMFGI